MKPRVIDEFRMHLSGVCPHCRHASTFTEPDSHAGESGSEPAVGFFVCNHCGGPVVFAVVIHNAPSSVEAEQPLDEEEDLSREVYARFGLAYYLAECVHRGLVNVFAALPFDKQSASRPRIEERYKAAESMTFGTLLPQVKELLPIHLHGHFDWALEQRNFLAHGFWFERIHLMSSVEGMREAISFLTATSERLRYLSHQLDELAEGHLRQLGVSEDALEAALQESKSRPPDPSPTRAVPKTDEPIEIVAAWVSKREGNLGTLFFRDRNGEMWQLCDAGLGWCYEEGPNDSWVPCAQLAPLLPARIVARPKGAKPWDYKLHISTGALLCVSQDDESGFFRWSVQSKKRN